MLTRSLATIGLGKGFACGGIWNVGRRLLLVAWVKRGVSVVIADFFSSSSAWVEGVLPARGVGSYMRSRGVGDENENNVTE